MQQQIRGAPQDGDTIVGELLVRRDRFDGIALLNLIERHGTTLH